MFWVNAVKPVRKWRRADGRRVGVEFVGLVTRPFLPSLVPSLLVLCIVVRDNHFRDSSRCAGRVVSSLPAGWVVDMLLGVIVHISL